MRDAASRGGWGDGGMRRAAATAGASLLPAHGPGIAAAGSERERKCLTWGLRAGGKGRARGVAWSQSALPQSARQVAR